MPPRQRPGPLTQAALLLTLAGSATLAGFWLYHSLSAPHQNLFSTARNPPPATADPNTPNPPTSTPSIPDPNNPLLASVPLLAPGASTDTLPTRLPDIALPDASGHLHHLSEYGGKTLLLNFWASWCEPCRREIPLLETLHHDRGEALRVVGIALDFQADALKFAQAQGMDYPLLMGETTGLAVAKAVGINELALPFTVVADKQGNIVTVRLGELHRDEADLILARVDDLSTGRSTLAKIRRELPDMLRDLAVIRAKDTQLNAN